MDEKKGNLPISQFCFLNNADNQKIKDKAPSEYVKFMNQQSITDILDAALCPEDTFSISYDEFISKRKEILTKYARELIK